MEHFEVGLAMTHFLSFKAADTDWSGHIWTVWKAIETGAHSNGGHLSQLRSITSQSPFYKVKVPVLLLLLLLLLRACEYRLGPRWTGRPGPLPQCELIHHEFRTAPEWRNHLHRKVLARRPTGRQRDEGGQRERHLPALDRQGKRQQPWCLLVRGGGHFPASDGQAVQQSVDSTAGGG